jgi:hypothetical protein
MARRQRDYDYDPYPYNDYEPDYGRDGYQSRAGSSPKLARLVMGLALTWVAWNGCDVLGHNVAEVIKNPLHSPRTDLHTLIHVDKADLNALLVYHDAEHVLGK